MRQFSCTNVEVKLLRMPLEVTFVRKTTKQVKCSENMDVSVHDQMRELLRKHVEEEVFCS